MLTLLRCTLKVVMTVIKFSTLKEKFRSKCFLPNSVLSTSLQLLTQDKTICGNDIHSPKMHYYSQNILKNIAEYKAIKLNCLTVSCFRRIHLNCEIFDQSANSKKGIFLINVVVNLLVKISHAS